MASREKTVYFAKLAEKSARCDEIPHYMEAVGRSGGELSEEERNLLSVAYKNAVGSRLASWRKISSVEQEEKSKGNDENAKFAKEYCSKLEDELDKICKAILDLLDQQLSNKTTSSESKFFFQKMKADCFRSIAEFSEGDKKNKAAESASRAYEEAQKHTEKPRKWPWLLLCIPLNSIAGRLRTSSCMSAPASVAVKDGVLVDYQSPSLLTSTTPLATPLAENDLALARIAFEDAIAAECLLQ